MNEILELETRRKIYELITKNPGLHFSKIADMLHLRLSLVEYHLLYLEKNKIIISVKEKGYKRYYVEGTKIGVEDKKILSLLRQEIPLRIVLFLIKNANSKHRDILKYVDCAPSTLSYHLKKLVTNGIIAIKNNFGKEGVYNIVNKNEIIKIIVSYKPYAVLESFKDIWGDLTV
jgi:predicted transcriptional regulator